MCVAHKEFKPKRTLQKRNSLAPRDYVVRFFLAVVDENRPLTTFVALQAQRQLPRPWLGGHVQ